MDTNQIFSLSPSTKTISGNNLSNCWKKFGLWSTRKKILTFWGVQGNPQVSVDSRRGGLHKPAIKKKICVFSPSVHKNAHTWKKCAKMCKSERKRSRIWICKITQKTNANRAPNLQSYGFLRKMTFSKKIFKTFKKSKKNAKDWVNHRKKCVKKQKAKKNAEKKCKKCSFL